MVFKELLNCICEFVAFFNWVVFLLLFLWLRVLSFRPLFSFDFLFRIFLLLQFLEMSEGRLKYLRSVFTCFFIEELPHEHRHIFFLVGVHWFSNCFAHFWVFFLFYSVLPLFLGGLRFFFHSFCLLKLFLLLFNRLNPVKNALNVGVCPSQVIFKFNARVLNILDPRG